SRNVRRAVEIADWTNADRGPAPTSAYRGPRSRHARERNDCYLRDGLHDDVRDGDASHALRRRVRDNGDCRTDGLLPCACRWLVVRSLRPQADDDDPVDLALRAGGSCVHVDDTI